MSACVAVVTASSEDKMKNLDIIANSLGWEILPDDRGYHLDIKDGSYGYYCDNLQEVAEKLCHIIYQQKRMSEA